MSSTKLSFTPVPKSEWQPDKSAVECPTCNAKFGLVKRRHHCRCCGKVYCNSCCGLDGLVGTEAARICGPCKQGLNADPSTDNAEQEETEQPPEVFNDEVKTLVDAGGLQTFDEERDYEEEAEAGAVSGGQKALAVAKKVGRNMVLGAITSAPGLVFGVGGAVYGKAKSAAHEKKVRDQEGLVVITAIRASDLPNVRSEVTGFGSVVAKRSTQNPYMKASILAANVNPQSGAASDKSSTHRSGGSTFKFQAKTICKLGFPVDENTESAAVLITIKDEPESAVLSKAKRRDRTIGAAVVSLSQLVSEAQGTEETPGSGTSSHYINVNLFRGKEPAGMVRLNFDLTIKQR